MEGKLGSRQKKKEVESRESYLREEEGGQTIPTMRPKGQPFLIKLIRRHITRPQSDVFDAVPGHLGFLGSYWTKCSTMRVVRNDTLAA